MTCFNWNFFQYCKRVGECLPLIFLWLWFPFRFSFIWGSAAQSYSFLLPNIVGMFCLAVLHFVQNTGLQTVCHLPNNQLFFTQPKTSLLTLLSTGFASLHNTPLILHLTLTLFLILQFSPSFKWQMQKIISFYFLFFACAFFQVVYNG